MKAVEYRLSIPNLLLSRAVGRRFPAVHYGRLSPLRLIDRPAPELPGPDWIRLRPRLAGICGTDLGTITAKASPSLSPFSSFPAVLGHEVVGTVVESGSRVRKVAPGDRVTADPFISCAVRGLDPCSACRSGQTSLCQRSDEGDLAAGTMIGFCRDLPGSWSETMFAHRSQIFSIPEEISDEPAVLVEPLSICLHALLKAPAPTVEDKPSLIIGAGTIGLCTLAVFRFLYPGHPVAVIARHPHQQAMARRLGADHVFSSKESGAVEIAASLTGARTFEPLIGSSVTSGGFPLVFDCVGSARSLRDAITVTAPRGNLVLLGCAGEVSRFDWSFVWKKEIEITGSLGYGREKPERLREFDLPQPAPRFTTGGKNSSTGNGGRTASPGPEAGPHTYQLVIALLAENPDHPITGLVTHHFSLDSYRTALKTCLNRSSHPALKVVFDIPPA